MASLTHWNIKHSQELWRYCFPYSCVLTFMILGFDLAPVKFLNSFTVEEKSSL
jgi:hypothetical protein